jgi:probable F420-dependent oxidoreductase
VSRLGLELLSSLSVPEIIDLCAWAEDEGFDDAWLGEHTDPDVFVTLGVAALRTTRLRLGTAITALGPRSVPVLAAAASTMAQLGPRRFVLGVGVSNPLVVERWNGVPPGPPLRRARESVSLLRSLLAGEESDFEGQSVRSHGYRLQHPPEYRPPVVLAAMNVRMLELAGEIADGVFLNFLPLDAVPLAIEAVTRGADRAGRDMLPELFLSIPTEVTDDAEEARRAFANVLDFYLRLPPYQLVLEWYGFSEDAARARNSRAATASASQMPIASEALCRAVSAIGTVEHCRARFRAYSDAGIGTLSISAIGENPRVTLELLSPRRNTIGQASDR